ncbi:cell wall anchor protein [Catellatospora sp. KI3]|uniref:RCC1 domain-containing protein n=1 Tax=Catellatospora sp. KI3 TaxID=3041620 RepID=UPI002482EC61|nr:cell wall anchor protein [Catellatospora sp. KI3]MDI1463229.1 cell wall anchor protein [Catellatospora sp. KI3]
MDTMFGRRLVGAVLLGSILVAPLGVGDRVAAAPQAGFTPHPAVAWGSNADGRLGDGTTQLRQTPVAVTDLLSVARIDAGTGYGIALLANGALRAWGDNERGPLGDGTRTDHSTPGVVTGLDDVTAVAAGAVHVLALRRDGSVWAWGDNSSGQLGLGVIDPEPQLTPVRVPGLAKVRAVFARDSYSMAMLADGTVLAWGNNSAGVLGNGTFGTDDPNPTPVRGLRGVRTIAAGSGHVLALRRDGTVLSWGANNFGQLGRGTVSQTPSPVPAPVEGLSGVAAIATGLRHSLALRKDGTVRSWGDNSAGELGIGVFGGVRDRPVTVRRLAGARAVAAGFDTSYALSRSDDDVVHTWGRNDTGQLGDGSTTGRALPVTIQTSLDAVSAVAAGNGFALAAG